MDLPDNHSSDPLPEIARVQSKKASTTLLVCYIALGAALIGSFLPWARVLFFTVNGTDGDGILSALASGGALLCLLTNHRSDRRRTGLLGFAAFGATATSLVYIYNFVNIANINSESSDEELFQVTATPQFGMIAGALGAVVGTIATFKLLAKREPKDSIR